MLKITQYLAKDLRSTDQQVSDYLTLAFEQRQKGRFKALSDQGIELGVFLERGQVLAHDDLLRAEDGRIFAVVAQSEPVITAYAEEWASFARACYHLGNRHVTLQLGDRWLRFAPDHVLEHLAEHLGLRLEKSNAPFHPESGAYHGHHGSHDDHDKHSHHTHHSHERHQHEH